MSTYESEIYPYIVLIDEVAYVVGPQVRVPVSEVMTALAQFPESKVQRTLRLHGHHIKAAEDFARDSWCTPVGLAKLLPPRDRLMDPCSNPRSVVDAATKYMLEHGQNGRELPWFGLVFVNGGFSDLLPWTAKLASERLRAEPEKCEQCGEIVRYWNDDSGGNASCACCVEGPEACAAVFEGACFLVNTDNSTKWWWSLTDQLSCVLHLNSRQRFEPHPGVQKSTNNKPQSLIGDRAFFEECHPDLFAMGEMYERTTIRRAA